MSALKSQYEGRLNRQERELRDLRGQQERQEQRDEPPEAGPSKVRVSFTGLWHQSVGLRPDFILDFRHKSSRGVLNKGRSI